MSYFIILVVELNCNRLFVIVECQIKYNCCVEIIDLVLVIASNLSLFELLILQFNSYQSIHETSSALQFNSLLI